MCMYSHPLFQMNIHVSEIVHAFAQCYPGPRKLTAGAILRRWNICHIDGICCHFGIIKAKGVCASPETTLAVNPPLFKDTFGWASSRGRRR